MPLGEGLNRIMPIENEFLNFQRIYDVIFYHRLGTNGLKKNSKNDDFK